MTAVSVVRPFHPLHLRSPVDTWSHPEGYEETEREDKALNTLNLKQWLLPFLLLCAVRMNEIKWAQLPSVPVSTNSGSLGGWCIALDRCASLCASP